MSRAYIAFKTPEELATFSQNYDGHIFKDKQGNEYSAIVEFAPSQKLPLANPKVDTRQGTIDDDEGYKSFLELLERGENPSKEKPPPQVIIDPSKPESTPLLESLITAKSHGFKSSKHKVAHLHAAKNNQADDAHFSRAQPIVPSGPVTLLTSNKAESSKAAQAPPSIPKSPQGKTNPETPAKGKGKGKANANANAPPEQQATASPSKPPKSKGGGGGGQKKGANTDAGVVAEKEKQIGTKDEPNGKKSQGQGKKKKQQQATEVDGTVAKLDTEASQPLTETTTGVDASTSATTAPTTREGPKERGRGRPSRGRGGLVLVPKILTKIITEGSSNAPQSSKGPQRTAAGGEPSTPASAAGENTAATNPQPTNATATQSNSVTNKETNVAIGNEEGGATPSGAPAVRGGGERGRRPFYRGRGRGRGRGGAKAGDGGS
ncbi:hypothetical protein FRB91_000970 [Serendipita sp. 411]|nr:hypothetical protein FRB91_000970 [Serendipita sp. 411]